METHQKEDLINQVKQRYDLMADHLSEKEVLSHLVWVSHFYEVRDRSDILMIMIFKFSFKVFSKYEGKK